MDQPKNFYFKTDDNRIINESCIKWVKKVDECMRVCTKDVETIDGCYVSDTHLICKSKTPKSYEKLNRIFEDTY